MPVLRARCQRQSYLGEHSLAEWMHGRTYRGLGIRSGILRKLRGIRAPKSGQGARSRYQVGDWVRILEEPTLQKTLDTRKRTRGLLWAPQQWGYCGRVARVSRVVQQILDDDGRLRAVSRTVLLEGVDCGGVDGKRGCGRFCPLMFRDEWLEPAEEPAELALPEAPVFARVKPLRALRASLDVFGRHDGVMWTSEMAKLAGMRLPIAHRLTTIYEADRLVALREPLYQLEGANCDGLALGCEGLCDRGCPLVFHADWLEIEDEATHPTPRLSPLEQLAAHELRAWKDVTSQSPAFLGTEFMRLVARHTHEGTPMLALVPKGTHGGGAGAALALRRMGYKLLALQSDQTPRFDMAGDPTALPALWDLLRGDETWDILELEDVPSSSPLLQVLPELARADGFSVVVHAELVSPYFELDGFESRLTAKFKANLRRCAKNLGEVSLETQRRFDRQALEEGFGIELRSWKGESETAIACEVDRHRFYVALARALMPHGTLVANFLRANDERIAFEIGIEDSTTHYALKIAFDPKHYAHSPGHLLMERVARDAHQRGLHRLDFLGWDQEWKRKWTNETIAHGTLEIYRPSARGRALYAAREVVRPQLVRVKHTLVDRAPEAPS